MYFEKSDQLLNMVYSMAEYLLKIMVQNLKEAIEMYKNKIYAITCQNRSIDIKTSYYFSFAYCPTADFPAKLLTQPLSVQALSGILCNDRGSNSSISISFPNYLLKKHNPPLLSAFLLLFFSLPHCEVVRRGQH